MATEAKRAVNEAREGQPGPETQAVIVYDLLTQFGFEVHTAAKKQPYDLFFKDPKGPGVAVKCGVSHPAKNRRPFSNWLQEAVSVLPAGINELWLVDTSVTRKVLEIADRYKPVHIWELDQLIQRYGKGSGKTIDLRTATALVGAVTRVLKQEGFRPMVSMEMSGHAPLDITFEAANGDLIGVYCGRPALFQTERSIEQWLERAFEGHRRLKEILIVNMEISPQLVAIMDAYSAVELVEYPWLAAWLKRYKERPRSRPQLKGRSKKAAAHAKTNKAQILMAIEALAASIDDKLEILKRTRPNSYDSITAWEATISDYERLRTQALELKEAVKQLSVSQASQAKVEKKAGAFGTLMSKWLEKDAGAVLTTASNVGVFCLGALLCTLMGVSPEVAAGATAVVVAGKRSGKAAKKLTKAATGVS